MSKKVNEIGVAASSAVGGFAKPIGEETVSNAFTPVKKKGRPSVVIYPSEPTGRADRPYKGIKEPKQPKKWKRVSMETKAESMLRETIRELIFLNKVKFYEEQAKQALEENKLRYVIRGLLMEKDDVIFSTTGQNEGNAILKRMRSIFDRYSMITSQQKDREDYKKGFITAMTVTLNNLKKSLSLFGGEQTAVTPAPAKRKDLDEQGDESVDMTGEETEPVGTVPAQKPQVDDKTIEKQAQDNALKMFPKVATSDSADIKKGISDVTKIIADFVNTYRNLSDEKFQVTEKNGQSRTTSDRDDFEKFLLGDPNTSTPGNIQIEFDKIDDTIKSSDATETPEPVKIVTSAKKEAETVSVDQSQIPAAPGVEAPEAQATTPEDLAAQV